MLKKISFLSLFCLLLLGCQTVEESVVDIGKSVPDLDEQVEIEKNNEGEELASVDTSTVTTEPGFSDMVAIYDSIPEEFKYEGYTLATDEAAWIIENDPSNYYLHVSPSGIEGELTLAIFLDKQGERTYAISTTGCGPFCQQWLYFLKIKEGAWVDVSSEVLPEIPEEDRDAKYFEIADIRRAIHGVKDDVSFSPIYKLPQFGTTIELEDQYDGLYGPPFLGPLYNFKWNWETGRFNVEEVSLDQWK